LLSACFASCGVTEDLGSPFSEANRE